MSEPVGTMAEEAAKLLGAVEGWLHSARGGDRRGVHSPSDHGDPSDAPEDAAAKAAPLGPDCRVCPICQLVHVVRTSRPELLDHLTEAATHLAQAVRLSIESSEHRWAARRPDAGVERIDIS